MAEVFLLLITVSSPLIVMFGLVFGLQMSKNHEATSTFELPAPELKVWSQVSDISAYPVWVENVLETICENENEKIWRQESKVVPLRYQVKNFELGKSFSLEIMPKNIEGKNIPVQGNFSISLKPISDTRTEVTLHHKLSLNDPLLRTFLFYFHRKDHPVYVFQKSLKKIFPESSLA